MFPNSKQKLDSNDAASLAFSKLPFDSHKISMTKAFGLQRNNFQMRQKTTAESISETKRMLSNGVRLVSTRRPVTPRELRRQLYGKISLADRPPSAFSLSYLQVENRILPPIPSTSRTKLSSLSVQELIASNRALNDEFTSSTLQQIESSSILERTKSHNETYANTCITEKGDNSSNMAINLNTGSKTNRNNVPPKLPTIVSESKIVAVSNSLAIGKSLKNNLQERKINNVASSIIDILECDEQINLSLTDEPNQSTVNNQPIAEQRRLLLRANDLLAQSSTETLLEMLKSHAGIKTCSEETVLHINGILTELYTRVKDDWRSSILSSLYGLVECSSARILLAVARVVLALDVTGSNLTGACKLVFKVARNERNDNLFANIDVPELLIDGLGRDAEACIYGYGAVRFLANAEVSPMPNNSKNKTLACRLIQHGSIPLMILHLQMINEAGAATKLATQSLHALYQLSSTFRVLSKILMSDRELQLTLSKNNNTNHTIDSAIMSGRSLDSIELTMKITQDFDSQITLAGPHLIRAAEICINQVEVQLSVIRTLSILSEHDSCCGNISDMSTRLGILLGPIFIDLSQHQRNNTPENVNSTSNKSLSALNRLGYILGNVMAKSDAARQQFYNNDVAMEYLLNCLEYYANESKMLNPEKRTLITNDVSNGDDANDFQIDTVIDVLIKLIRVVANLSVNAEVGYKLANHHQLGAILLTLLNTINKHHIKFNSELEELLMASLGAIHNLSFYQNAIDDCQTRDSKETNHPDSMIKQMATISASLCAIYQWSPASVQSEIARVLGNLTRSLDARDAVHSADGLQFLLKNLSSNDLEIVATSCGVLVNMLSDWEQRAPFRELRGPLLLRDVLQRSAMERDWFLALITCQAMWNYIIDSGNVIGALGEDEADYISGDILEYLDEEKLFEGSTPDPDWEEFAIVAADLLERIQSSLSYNNTPFASSDEDDDDNNYADSISKTGFKMWLANS